jgi:hypothetical protein
MLLKEAKAMTTIPERVRLPVDGWRNEGRLLESK